MKLIIAGGRDFEDHNIAMASWTSLNLDLDPHQHITEIVSGGANGADLIGEQLATHFNIPCERFPADWDKHGKSAGYIRNEEMAKYGDYLLAFWDGHSKGTKHMIDCAEKEGLPVKLVKYNTKKPNPLSVIYDFETTDKKPTSAVASLAVIVFDPSELKTFDELVSSALRIKFKLTEQYATGRTWSQDTVDWWMHPDQKDAFEMVIKPDERLDVPLSSIEDYITFYLAEMGFDYNNSGKIYTRGNSFDCPILSNIYQQYGYDEPFPWWNIRDVRTEIDAIVPYWDDTHEGYGYIRDFPYPDNFVKHKETHDCARDILMLQHAHIGLINKIEELSVGGGSL